MSVGDLDPRFLVAASRRILANNGCESQVAGHVSLRADGEEAFWMTPFQYFDETLPADVGLVNFDLAVVEGTLDASPAVAFHAGIYQARSDVNSIIHIHSHYISVFSTLGRPVGMYNVESVLFHEDQALCEDDGTRPAVETARLVEALGQEKHVIIIKNHGAIVAGSNIGEATVKAATLERCARYHLEAEAAGGTEFPELYVVQGKPKYHQYYVPQMWEANLRRLRKSDPELFADQAVGGISVLPGAVAGPGHAATA
jgi:L-fuculose-phosphate aldolase